MTPEERQELQSLMKEARTSLCQPLGAVVGALVALAASLILTSDPRALLLTVLSGGLLGNAGAWVLVRRRNSSLRDALDRDLRTGKVEVYQVAPRDVVRVTCPGGSVAGYFAGMGGGTMMFIEPREWENPGEDDFERLFPCTWFSLARAPRSKVDLGFTCNGEHFPPLRDIPVASEEALQDWVEDGDVLWASLDVLERRLR
ncbi:MAG TPA: hypothetical protein VKU80_10680 [Planctomycetota bacterium]|nr:hypothetical protein [Planctomycetota bacterium]